MHIHSYHVDITFLVKINNIYSDSKTIVAGVP